jgi:hypothetical protein
MHQYRGKMLPTLSEFVKILLSQSRVDLLAIQCICNTGVGSFWGQARHWQ